MVVHSLFHKKEELVDMERQNECNSGKLFVYFEEPFWVLVFERVMKEGLCSCKVTYGVEPKEYDIKEFIEKNYYNLTFSPIIKTEKKKKIATNPKRMQRQIQKQMKAPLVGTKSMQALKLLQETNKTERKERKKLAKEAFEQCVFEKKQQKKKQKHRGR